MTPIAPLSSAQATRIVVVLGLLSAFAPFATDMYLPGFDQMAADFGVAAGRIELTLSVFFLGLAVGQAIYGPLIDRFGRRGPLLVGVGIYVVATVGCLMTENFTLFTTLRFLQAIGGCAGMIIGRAIVSDLFDARESARVFSLLLVIMTMGPILGPIVGGFVITSVSWKATFLIMLAFGLLCFGLVWFVVPETCPPEKRRADDLIGIIAAWRALLGARAFAVPALVGGLAQAGMFAFITGSSFVFVNVYGVSPQTFGLLFALTAFALVVFAELNRFALKRLSPARMLGIGLVLNLVAGIGTVLAVPLESTAGLLLPLWFAIGALGFVGANAAALAMAASRSFPGSGSSLVGGLQFGCAFLVSGLVAMAQNGTAYPMTIAISICAALAAGCWFLSRARVAA